MSDRQWLKTLDDSVSTSPAKRIKLNLLAPRAPATPSSVNPSLSAVLESLESVCDDTGRARCDIFATLPDAKEYPDYYTLIKGPISMSCIRDKLVGGKYVSVDDLQADLDRMFNNAMHYNAEGSQVYEDAAWLMEYAHDLVSELQVEQADETDEEDQVVEEGSEEGEEDYQDVEDDGDYMEEEEE